jgi:2'-5' RNA ligase
MPLCLLAVLTTPEIDKEVTACKEYMLSQFGCKVALKSPAHITLVAPFNLATENIPSLEGDLKNFASKHKGFRVQLNGFNAFPPRVIYVHVIENSLLANLKVKLEEELLLKDYPIKKENRPFHPHVTIANRDLDKNDFPIAWQEFKGKPFEAEFYCQQLSFLEHNGQIWNTRFHAPLA